MTVNVYCRDLGWLFEDLKRDIAAVAGDVVASEEPLPDADAWICVRTDEAAKCPDLSRLVVQAHDFRLHNVPPGFGALSLVHERQAEVWSNWIHPEPTTPRVNIQPIGARRLFTLREHQPERFTVGWVGRDVTHAGRHIKRPQMFVDAVLAARGMGCEVVARMYGGDHTLAPYAETLAEQGCLDYQSINGDRSASLLHFFHSLDALIVTTEDEPGPLSVYEALACGVPVIGTRRSGAIEQMADNPGVWIVGDTVEDFARQIVAMDPDAPWSDIGGFRLIDSIREKMPYRQEDWCAAQVELARGLVR